ncbi:MAG: hypothetical protein K1X67_02300 [Fimbriimonadaceae bacterium]|nr:hypothetical protein [Fimbriimonadaceae bacterium]
MKRAFVLGLFFAASIVTIGCGPASQPVASNTDAKPQGAGIAPVDKAREVAGQADARSGEADSVSPGQ